MKKAEAGEAVNVSEEIVKLTNNVISQMMLSIRCSGTKGEAKEARNLVHEVTRIFGEFNVSDFILMCRSLDLQGFGKRIEDIHERYDGLLEKIITNREELRKKKPEAERTCEDDMKDFLDILLDILEDNNSDMKLTRDHVKALVLDFLTAATDSSATAIEWALAELINNPTVLKKAQEEIDEVVGEHRIVEESDWSKSSIHPNHHKGNTPSPPSDSHDP
ncbi:hypothetical protein F0562_021892 [Nyssa sinensis]|uniref:Uncharacterized protein n=1 Tax=Nyssa sinensis TaxID=561372 RepID=A0A5J5BRW6_9ASTE|nr:hypothetical protein F0562_021892 [Nyssa sinensis]